MDPSEITTTHIIFSCICAVFIVISTINALEFIILKEYRNPIYDDISFLMVLYHALQYICIIFSLLLALILPIMYICTVCGYYTPLIDIIANAGG